ncbi:hypothetical protein JCM10213_003103 [Rhodosporidiobolus nylandii]
MVVHDPQPPGREAHHLPGVPSSPSFSSSEAHSHLTHPFRARSIESSAYPHRTLYPTHAALHYPHPYPAAAGNFLSWRWSSRAHRKGVPPIPIVEGEKKEEAAEEGGRAMSVRKEGWSAKGPRDVWRFVRETRWWGWDLGDISWWIAFIFTLGSVFWCIQGIMVFCYFSNTSTAFLNTEAAFAFLGGTVFWAGAYLGWVEALNPAELGGSFGWEVKAEGRLLLQPRRAHSSLGLRRRHFGSYAPSSALSSSSLSSTPSTPSPQRKWLWFAFPPLRRPSPPDSPISWRNLGYLANTVQFFGATCFQVSVICGLPGVLPASGAEGGVEQQGRVERIWVAAYWVMQVVGSPCFVFAGLVFAIEVQKRWYIPKLTSIGWHVGIWNVIGGFGFWFSGIFGIFRQTSISDPNAYQYWGTAFSTFWGSWAFLIGSYLQLLETLNKWS